jgi:hypothetical protein
VVPDGPASPPDAMASLAACILEQRRSALKETIRGFNSADWPFQFISAISCLSRRRQFRRIAQRNVEIGQPGTRCTYTAKSPQAVPQSTLERLLLLTGRIMSTEASE